MAPISKPATVQNAPQQEDGLFQPVIPKDLAFKYWCDLGTLRKAAERFKSDGYINPQTGNPFSPRGIQIAAYKYMFQEPKIARAKFLEIGHEWASDDDDWGKYIANLASRYLKGSALAKFLKEYDFEKYYEYPLSRE